MKYPQIMIPSEEVEEAMLEPKPHEYFKGKVRESIESLTPALLLMDEQTLIAKLNPTAVDYDLRRAFWQSIADAKKLQQTHVPSVRIYEGICNQSYFTEYVLNTPLRVAWISRPIINHAAFYEVINRVALQKLLDYIRDHKISEKNLAAVIKIAEMSANRAYGAVAQKMQIQSKNLNVEVKGTAEAVPAPDVQQLNQRVADLQSKLLEQAKDVTPNTKE